MSFVRSRWAAVGAAVAVSLGAGGVSLVGASIDSGDKPVTVFLDGPCRMRDTRATKGVGGRTTPLGAGETYSVPGTGPSGECNVPAGAVGLVTNVTAVGATADTNLRLFPTGGTLPGTSSMNPRPGAAPTPNSVTVGLNGSGEFSVYNAKGTVDVIIDVAAYLVDHTHDDRYYTEDEIDALLAGITAGTGAAYENVIVVAKSGGDFTSVTAAMNSISDASSSSRYLVWVAPGVYDNEDVDMQPFVDIQGSGQDVTVLTSTGGTGGLSPDSATLVGAANAELRDLSVEIEAADPSVWAHAIYTAESTTFKNVTASASGGSRSRGMVVAGGVPGLIDVLLFARDGSVSNIGLDLFNAAGFADGVFAAASGGTNSAGVLINGATDEVLLENISVSVSGGTTENVGLKIADSSVTVEGLRSIVTNSPGSTFGVSCVDEGRTVRVLGATIYAEASASGSVAGVYAFDCNLEVRDAVIDAVTANGTATGISHVQSDSVTQADVAIAGVEARAFSSGSAAFGLRVASSGGSPAGTYGRVSETNVRATGGSQSVNSAAVSHEAHGEVQYRGLSIIAEGSANFMYGISANDGVARFDDVVIAAVGAAESTVFGVEIGGVDRASLTHARIEAINTDSGSFHDAVGFKANSAPFVEFTDITTYAEAETNVWGVDLVSSQTRLTSVVADAFSTTDGVALGTRCAGGDTEIRDAVLGAESASSSAYGLNIYDCSGTVSGSEMRGTYGPSTYGLYAQASTAQSDTITVRNSLLVGASGTVRTLGSGNMTVLVSGSTLDGGAGSSASGTDTQECTAVTYNSGGSDAFQASTSDPCP